MVRLAWVIADKLLTTVEKLLSYMLHDCLAVDHYGQLHLGTNIVAGLAGLIG